MRSHYEAVMWVALCSFYISLVSTGLSIALFPMHGMYRLVGALVAVTFGCWAGAGMAREIYMDTRDPNPPAAKFRRPE